MAGLSRRATTLIGVGCAVLCALCVFLYLHQVRGEAQAARAEALERYGGEQIEVCVATRDISAGETIDLSSVKTMLWLADLLPEQAVQSVDEILGKQATSRILAGEAISLKRFESNSATFDVPAGLSAVSVPAKDVQAVGGTVSPGMKVDLYATGASSTRLLAKDVLVLATSSSAAGESGGSSVSWVAVAVEPALVEDLVSAAQSSQIYFVVPGTQADSSAGSQGGADTTASPSASPNAAANSSASNPSSSLSTDIEEIVSGQADGEISESEGEAWEGDGE